MRLNAYLARAGVASRRGADKIIISGQVWVNGKLAKLNTTVNDSDKVIVSGKTVRPQKLRYILLHKPAGVVTTLKDPEGRPTILNLLSISQRVVPVGRLDYDTTGALLLTNDGQLAQRLMHPSFEIDKVYEAVVEGTITTEKLKKLASGILIDNKTTAPAKALKIATDKVQLTIHEGRKHQVKKMLAAVDLPVKKLHRSVYTGLSVDNLKIGQWRELTPDEVQALKEQTV